jgi:hypothetical protein
MMTNHDPELEPFAKFIGAIDPWLGQVVLIGVGRNLSRGNERDFRSEVK